MLNDWIGVGIGVLLTVGTALFVAAEFSLVALDPGIVEANTKKNDRRGQSVLRALRSLSTQLSGAQVGITLTTILLGYTAQPAVQRLVDGALASWAISVSVAAVLSTVLTMVLVNLFSMIFGELVPKNSALARPLATARMVSPFMRGFTLALKPLISWFNSSANAILGWFGVEAKEELSGGRSRQELASLVRRSAQMGTLDLSTARLLTNSIELDTLTAVDVMTDRTRLETIRREDAVSAVIELAKTSGHSRFPVIGESADDVVGLVNLRRAIAVPYEKRDEVPAAAVMTDAPRVPETVTLGPLLVELRSAGMQMAIVVDEYGGTSGLVTLEDVVEELVGDVSDEHDRGSSDAFRHPEGGWSVSGLLRPDELQEKTGLKVVDDGPYETVAGFVLTVLGRLPEVGDKVELPNLTIEVTARDGRRVSRLRCWPTEVDASTEGSVTP